MAADSIIVVGAGGRLGQALVAALGEAMPAREVMSLTRQEADLSQADSVARALEAKGFDTLLLAAAMTDVDGCERDPVAAQRLNADAPGECARLCAARGAKMIHFSTDYVFDGEAERPYTESDPPNPQSVYGKSKLAGEEQVLAASVDHLVVRLSWLYGPGGQNATPDWTIARAVTGGGLRIVDDKFGSPSYSPDIAEATLGLVAKGQARGILHLNNAGGCSWIEWVRECLEAARDAGLLEAVPEIDRWSLDECFAGKAPRPRYSVMANERYRELVGSELRPWQEGVRDYVFEHVAPRLRDRAAK